jgi:Resolvase, N terminal domain
VRISDLVWVGSDPLLPATRPSCLATSGLPRGLLPLHSSIRTRFECGQVSAVNKPEPIDLSTLQRPPSKSFENGLARDSADLSSLTDAKDRRPELDRLMTDARRRRFDIVLVARFDRFARSTRHLIMALEEFQSLAVDFISSGTGHDGIGPSEAPGQATRTAQKARRPRAGGQSASAGAQPTGNRFRIEDQ